MKAAYLLFVLVPLTVSFLLASMILALNFQWLPAGLLFIAGLVGITIIDHYEVHE